MNMVEANEVKIKNSKLFQMQTGQVIQEHTLLFLRLWDSCNEWKLPRPWFQRWQNKLKLRHVYMHVYMYHEGYCEIELVFSIERN